MAKTPALVLLDQWGWSFDFVSRGLIKHGSKFEFTAKRWNEVNMYDRRFHYVLALNCSVWHALSVRRRWLHAPQTKHFIGAPRDIADPRLHGDMRQINGVACNNLIVYSKLRKKYPGSRKIFYTPNGVDPERFKPQPLGDRFVVGWSGTVEWDVKRVELARKLRPRPKIKCDRFGRYFQKGVSQQPMIDFYKGCDAFVLTSNSEGMPNVILEAAAMGLPIVSTRVGDIPLLISKEWLVPVNPPALVVSEIQKRLDLLRSDPKLRRRVGARNRQEVVKNWSWKRQVLHYETMFLRSPSS